MKSILKLNFPAHKLPKCNFNVTALSETVCQRNIYIVEAIFFSEPDWRYIRSRFPVSRTTKETKIGSKKSEKQKKKKYCSVGKCSTVWQGKVLRSFGN